MYSVNGREMNVNIMGTNFLILREYSFWLVRVKLVAHKVHLCTLTFNGICQWRRPLIKLGWLMQMKKDRTLISSVLSDSEIQNAKICFCRNTLILIQEFFRLSLPLKIVLPLAVFIEFLISNTSKPYLIAILPPFLKIENFFKKVKKIDVKLVFVWKDYEKHSWSELLLSTQ